MVVSVCRFARHYMEDKIQKRTLLKVFGIRFDIIVQSLVSNTFILNVLLSLEEESKGVDLTLLFTGAEI